MLEQLQSLMKSLEAGSYNASPDSLTQGAALQMEDLSPVMQLATYNDSAIKLQKAIDIKDTKSQLVQFNRQLSYGIFGASAQFEGQSGEEDTSNYARITVPMFYYSKTRRVSIAANMVAAFDGVQAEDRAASDAAIEIAGDIEFDLFRGQDDFSENGFFTGSPAAVASVPNMVGVGAQVRVSDSLSNTQDLMFNEYGSNQTVVLSANGSLTQSIIEDSAVRSAMNHGSADKFFVDPIALSAYNKIAHAKERIVLAGSAQASSGAELRQQWTSSSLISLEQSRFLSGKTGPAPARAGSPVAPSLAAAAAADANSVLAAGTYAYYVTAVGIRGESVASTSVSQAATAGQKITLTIGAVSGAAYYNVYRSNAGGSAASAKLIGKVKASGAGSTSFIDLGLKNPGSVTGFLLQTNTWGAFQLAPYSRLKMAVSDLSLPESHFRFLTLAGFLPRRNVLVDNITGQLS